MVDPQGAYATGVALLLPVKITQHPFSRGEDDYGVKVATAWEVSGASADVVCVVMERADRVHRRQRGLPRLGLPRARLGRVLARSCRPVQRRSLTMLNTARRSLSQSSWLS